jgi:hypothetical protein
MHASCPRPRACVVPTPLRGGPAPPATHFPPMRQQRPAALSPPAQPAGARASQAACSPAAPAALAAAWRAGAAAGVASPPRVHAPARRVVPSCPPGAPLRRRLPRANASAFVRCIKVPLASSTTAMQTLRGGVLGSQTANRVARLAPKHAAGRARRVMKAQALMGAPCTSRSAFSGTRLAARPALAQRGRGKAVVVRAMFERFTEKAIKVVMLAQVGRRARRQASVMRMQAHAGAAWGAMAVPPTLNRWPLRIAHITAGRGTPPGPQFRGHRANPARPHRRVHRHRRQGAQEHGGEPQGRPRGGGEDHRPRQRVCGSRDPLHPPRQAGAGAVPGGGEAAG